MNTYVLLSLLKQKILFDSSKPFSECIEKYVITKVYGISKLNSSTIFIWKQAHTGSDYAYKILNFNLPSLL